MRKTLWFFLCLIAATPAFAQVNGVYDATSYGSWVSFVARGNPSTGASNILSSPTVTQPFFNTNAPITINRNGTDAETVTPSSLSNCFPNSVFCTIRATFASMHISGEPIQSGTFGLQEAINAAMTAGAGTVLVDATWGGPAGTSLITAAQGSTSVIIQDNRTGVPQFYQWQTNAYVLASGGGGSNSAFNQVVANGLAGADINAKVMTAYNSLPLFTDKNGQVWPAGTIRVINPSITGTTTAFTSSTNIVLNSPYVALIYDKGVVNYTGAGFTGDFIRIQGLTGYSGIGQWQPQTGTQVIGLYLLNLQTAGVSGVHLGDMTAIVLRDIDVQGFNNGPNGDSDNCSGIGGASNAGIWVDNALTFTEQLILDNVKSTENCIQLRVTKQTIANNSFAYLKATNVTFGGRNHEIGMSVENGTFLYNAYFQGLIETNSTNFVAISMLGNATIGPPAGQQGGLGTFAMRGECVSCSTPYATLISMQSSSIFQADGVMSTLGLTISRSSIAAGATFLWFGNAGFGDSTTGTWWDQIADSFNIANSGVIQEEFLTNRMLMDNSLANIGWRTAGTTSIYNGFGPKAAGSSTICFNTGTPGSCTGSIEVNQANTNQATTKYAGNSVLGSGLAAVVGIVNSLNQTASLGVQGIVPSVINTDGKAQILVTCSLVPFSGAGSVAMTVSYTDNHGNAQSICTASASGTTPAQSGPILVQPQAGTAINVTTTVTGTISYDLNCSALQVQY